MSWWQKGPKSIWRYSSMVIAAEVERAPPGEAELALPYRAPGRPTGERRLAGLVYTGQRAAGEETVFVLRRVDLRGGVKVAWEICSPEPGVLVPERYGRVDDVVVIPEAAGVAAFDVRTGADRWRIQAPARLAAPPARFPDGLVRLVFNAHWAWTDFTVGSPPRLWVDPRTGELLPAGVAARREAEVGPDGSPGVPLIQVGADGAYTVDGLLAQRVVPSPGAQRLTRLVDPETGDLLATLPLDPAI